MDFGLHQTTDDRNNVFQKKKEIEFLVRKFLDSNNLDQRKILEAIITNLGQDNVDEQMLNFAIGQLIEKVNSVKKTENPDQIEIDKAVDLVVDWSLVKIKSKKPKKTIH